MDIGVAPRILSLTVAGLIGTTGTTSALSQTNGMEEIIVTANKREQDMQDVGISVTAFSGSKIRDFTWVNSEDIATQTPGLIATSTSGDSSVSLFNIRGVGQNDFADHQEAPVAIYVDGVYVGYTGAAAVQMFDLARVEVLRGPQGTLFGRNATAGLLHLISAQPTEEFEAYADLQLGDFDQVRFEGAVSGAITDNVLGRLSVLTDDADGYFENDFPGGEDLRERKTRSARGQLDFNPSDDIDIDLTLWSNIIDNAAGGAFDTRPTDGEVRGEAAGIGGVDFGGVGDEAPGVNDGLVRYPGFIDKDAKGIDLTVSWDFDSFTVTSITAFSDFEKNYLESASTSAEATQYLYGTTQDSTQFSQELRLDGDTERMRWQAGVFFLNLDGDFTSRDDLPTFGGSGNNDFSVETTSWSVFGQAEYDLTSDLTLIAGLRVINDDVDMRLDSFCTPAFIAFPGVPNDCSAFTGGPDDPLVLDVEGDINQSRTDTETAVNLAVNYKLDDNQMLYASFNRGVKGGGFTVPVDGFLRETELQYDPEILSAYELGYKGELADGAVRLNAGIFYYDYSDYQAFIFSGIASQVVNHDAEIYGAELELTVLPAEGWELQLGLSALDATVEDVGGSVGLTPQDEDMVLAPEISANFALRKTWMFAGGSTLLAQVDGTYVGEREFNTNSTVLTSGDSYELYNARVNYSLPNDHWQLSAFVRNLTDEEYLTYGYDIAGSFGNTLDIYGPPRWVGVQARYTW